VLFRSTAHLFTLLSDEQISVQICATATLCNIVLDFSPMKKDVVEHGGITKLVLLISQLPTTPDLQTLRLNALWACKNLLYQADSSVKRGLMSQLTYPALAALITDAQNVPIQEQAMNVTRNLVCGNMEDVQECFSGFGPSGLLSLLEMGVQQNTGVENGLLLQTLYTIVNISTGNRDHKDYIMNSTVLVLAIKNSLTHINPSIRIAAVWCVINLTWCEQGNVSLRIEVFRDIGILSILGGMKEDVDLDVRERVKCAIEQCEKDWDHDMDIC